MQGGPTDFLLSSNLFRVGRFQEFSRDAISTSSLPMICWTSVPPLYSLDIFLCYYARAAVSCCTRAIHGTSFAASDKASGTFLGTPIRAFSSTGPRCTNCFQNSDLFGSLLSLTTLYIVR